MGTISEKLTYLDETRENIRQSINSIGGSLTNSDTFRSYSDAIDEIYEKFPKVEGEGSNITLENTMEASIKSELNGDTSQDGTPTPSSPQPINVVSGDNEIKVQNKNLTLKNVKGYFGRDSILIYNDSESFVFYATQGETYTFSSQTAMNRGQYAKVETLNIVNNTPISNKTNISVASSYNSATFTCSFTGYCIVYVNSTANNAIAETFQIEKGSTATEYEEYKGQSYEINLGKNLLKFDLATAKLYNIQGTWNDNSYSFYGIDAIVNNDNTITIGSGAATAGYNFYLYRNETGKRLSLPAGTYTFSTNKTPATGNGNLAIRFRDNNGNTISGVSDLWWSGGTSRSVTRTINQDFQIAVYIQISTGTGITEPEKTYKIQIEKGNEATTYVPYKTPIELCKIGDYKDRIYKENGTWYLHKEIGKVVLDGSENWNKSGTTNNNQFIITNPVNNVNISTLGQYNNNVVSSIFSNYFTPVGNMANNNGSIGISFCNFSPDTQIRLGYGISSNINTVELLKTWLSTHNTIVYYVLATPTTTEITDSELIEQLAEFGDAKSYEGITNINVDGDLPIILNVKALEDIFSQ